jgi:hypothetical protein
MPLPEFGHIRQKDETHLLQNRFSEVVARGYIRCHQPESPVEAPIGAVTEGNSP